MKKLKIILLFLVVTAGFCFSSIKLTAQEKTESYQIFYDELSKYGTWILNPDYGYVWLPRVESGFIPYSTKGTWVYSELGWTWVSTYPWGWAPFHYGRWYTDAIYGPMWVPDNQWSPGWVSWRKSGDFYGWAPLGPETGTREAYHSGYVERQNRYTYVRGKYLGSANIAKRKINNNANVSIINNSIGISDFKTDRFRGVRYTTGPDTAEIHNLTGKPVVVVKIAEIPKPAKAMNKKTLQLYYPVVRDNNSSDPKPMPAIVESINNMKTKKEWIAENPQ